MGSDAFSLPVLEVLLRAGPDVDLVAVVTRPDRPAGRGRTVHRSPVALRSEQAGVPVLMPERVRRSPAVAEILELRPDVIVVASYGQILPDALLNAPPYRCLNLHPSLLPRHRGPSPVPAAILEGDQLTGTTLMLMSPRMDSGAILAQESTPVGPDETAGELEARLAEMSAALLERDLPKWIAGSVQPIPQVEDNATYTSLLRKEDGEIDWTLPAESLARRVRAFNPWPTAYTTWRGKGLRVLRAETLAGSLPPSSVTWDPAQGLLAGTGGGILLLHEVQLAGGRPAPAHAFYLGHRDIVGDVLGT